MMPMKSEDVENQRNMVKIALPQQENKNYPRLGKDAEFFFCCATHRTTAIVWVSILLISELLNLVFSLAGNMFNKNAAIIILDVLYLITTLVGHCGCVNDNLKLINFAQIACIVKASCQGVALLLLATSWSTLKEFMNFYNDEEDAERPNSRYSYRNLNHFKEEEESDKDVGKAVLTVVLIISIIGLALYANVAVVLGKYKKELKEKE